MDRRWWNSRIICSCRYAWTPFDGSIIGGQTRSSDSSSCTGKLEGEAGYLPDQLKVGVHSLGYVAESTQEAVDDFLPGYAHSMTELGKNVDGLR